VETLKRMEIIFAKTLWRLETVDLGGNCLPTRLELSLALKNGMENPHVTEYLIKNRHVMCRTHFKCLNYAGARNWDGFDCRNCPKALDPENRIVESEILDSVEDLQQVKRMRELDNEEVPRLPPLDGPYPPTPTTSDHHLIE
jgi:hypothetical protein